MTLAHKLFGWLHARQDAAPMEEDSYGLRLKRLYLQGPATQPEALLFRNRPLRQVA